MCWLGYSWSLVRQARETASGYQVQVTTLHKESDELRGQNDQLSHQLTDAEGKLKEAVRSLTTTQDDLLGFLATVGSASDIELLQSNVDWETTRSTLGRDASRQTQERRTRSDLARVEEDSVFASGGRSPGTGVDSPGFVNLWLSAFGLGVTPKPGQRLSAALVEQFPAVAMPAPGDLVVFPGEVGRYVLIFLAHTQAGDVGLGTYQTDSPVQILNIADTGDEVQSYRHVPFGD